MSIALHSGPSVQVKQRLKLHKLHKYISSAALSFMLAEMFDRAIDIQQITTAAR